MFISFEGIDGCGKSTQLLLLKEYLQEQGFEVISIREPGTTPFAESIRDILLSKEHHINAVSELMLFEAARSNLVEYIIKPALLVGKIVLSDRFFDSTTAYQGYGRGISVNDIKSLNRIASGGLKPDITIYLDISFEQALARSSVKEMDRIETSGEDFFLNVLKGFHEIANEEPQRFKTVNANQEIKETHTEILDIILPILNDKTS